MAIWGKKRNRYVDLSERMRKDQERIENLKADIDESKVDLPLSKESSSEEAQPSGGFFSFFGGSSTADTSSSSSNSGGSFENPDERKRKLSKKLSDMTSKIEDLENQIYHLKQKFEVLERKQKIGY